MYDKNVTLPVPTLVKVIRNYATRSTSPAEKHMIFVLTEEIGGELKSIVTNFNEQEFLTACGVKTEWATIAA